MPDDGVNPANQIELEIARESYHASTTYVDANFRRKWENALNMFQNRHIEGSKYYTDAYRHRSKIFRPKTRSMIRHFEAAGAIATFSNADVVSTDAVDQSNPQQTASAAIHKELLNHRLQHTIPWFQTVCGGLQDAATVGVVASYQYWKYQEIEEDIEIPLFTDEDGKQVTETIKGNRIVKDEPCVELLPIENIRLDQGADWTDPINSSPYVIRLFPMYIGDLKARMESNDPKTGQPKWNKLTDEQILSATRQTYDPTRQAREGKREDSKEEGKSAIQDFEIVWVHENFVRHKGKEMVFYTLGVEYVLSKMQPLEEVYFHGERPITLGCAIIETHKIFPDSPATLGQPLQNEANEVANSRLDNVKLVLNKRYLAKRSAQVDLRSLVRNVAGSVTLANDPMSDVVPIEFQDVTASSYAEQDRINADYDDLLGNFSTGSVQTNRRMNETVGGMAMISQSANQMIEYMLRTVVETWLEPTLRQLVKLEAYYETDTTVLAIAADKAQLFQRYGVNEITDELLKENLLIRVNVGMGATDPSTKLQKFLTGTAAYAQIVATAPPNFDAREAGKEIYGLLGYRDGERFLGEEGEDPRVEMVMQQAQAMVNEAMEKVQQAQQDVLKVAEETDREAESNQAERIQLEADRDKLRDRQLELDKQANDIKNAQEQIGASLQRIEVTRKDVSQEEQMALKNIKSQKALLDAAKKELDVAVEAAQNEANNVEAQVRTAESVANAVDSVQQAQDAILGSIEQLAKAMSAPKTKVIRMNGKTYTMSPEGDVTIDE